MGRICVSNTELKDEGPSGSGPIDPRTRRLRIVVLICAALDCFVMGTVYLYSVFQPFVMESFGATSAAASLPYTLSWMFMTVAQFLAGALHRRIGVKWTASLGLALMAAGCAGCSLLPAHAIAAFTVVYCLVIGLGLGLAYNTVAAAVVRWFPDSKGMATSASLGMIGGAGILLAPSFSALLVGSGLKIAFWVQALLFVPCIVFTLLVLKDAPRVGTAAVGTDASATSSIKVTVRVPAPLSALDVLRKLVRTRDAWLLVVLYFSLVPAYLIASSVFVSFGVAVKEIDASTAAWFVSAAALCQVIGRFVITGASDFLGRKAMFFTVLALLTVGALGLTFCAGALYAVAFCVLSFAYGGGVTSMPAIISDRLGTDNATQNIAFAELGTLTGSLFTSAIINVLSTEVALAFSGFFCCTLGISVLIAIYSGKRA